jgi:hypothetical protein
VRRLRPELWRQKNWLLHQDNSPYHTSFFTREFLSHHFDAIKVIEAESLAVLITLTEHDFQDAFKKRQNHWERAQGDFFDGNGDQ